MVIAQPVRATTSSTTVIVVRSKIHLHADLDDAFGRDAEEHGGLLGIARQETEELLGAVAVSAWNASLTWKGGARWTRKLWSVLVVLAAAIAWTARPRRRS